MGVLRVVIVPLPRPCAMSLASHRGRSPSPSTTRLHRLGPRSACPRVDGTPDASGGRASLRPPIRADITSALVRLDDQRVVVEPARSKPIAELLGLARGRVDHRDDTLVVPWGPGGTEAGS